MPSFAGDRLKVTPVTFVLQPPTVDFVTNEWFRSEQILRATETQSSISTPKACSY